MGKRLYRNISLILFVALMACGHSETQKSEQQLAIRVRHDIRRTWDFYQKYNPGKDALLPIDVFSTLVLSGLTEEADRVIDYVADSINLIQNTKVRVFEANTRILGGLLSMYQLSGDERILSQALTFADRLMPAFSSATGIPYFEVNLETGNSKGVQVNVAEAGTYLLEMGMLSYFTGKPLYYEAAKKSSRAVFDRRSEIGLVGELIDVETGEWLNPSSHVGAGIGSYYEYLYKGWILFGDPELKWMWDESIGALLKYIPEEMHGRIWYGHVNMLTGERINRVVTLHDAFMPGLLALSENLEEAERLQESWNWLWNKYGLAPMSYDYERDSILKASFELDPEIIESAWYLFELTGEECYVKMNEGYYADLLKYCSTDAAFMTVQNVESREKGDRIPGCFLSGTLKYFYLSFSDQDMYNPGTVVFSTRAYPFLKAALDREKVRKNLNIP